MILMCAVMQTSFWCYNMSGMPLSISAGLSWPWSVSLMLSAVHAEHLIPRYNQSLGPNGDFGACCMAVALPRLREHVSYNIIGRDTE